jgi:hypothetical protein
MAFIRFNKLMHMDVICALASIPTPGVCFRVKESDCVCTDIASEVEYGRAPYRIADTGPTVSQIREAPYPVSC